MVDPSDKEGRERYERTREARRREGRYLERNARNIEGGRFFAVGAFAMGMAGAHFDRLGLSFLWDPAAAVSLFALCYLAFLGLGSWYARNPPAGHLGGTREGFLAAIWVPLGLVLFGSLMGLTACAAGLAVAAWLYACWRSAGTIWKHYAWLAVPLVPSSIVPPALAWPTPNLFAVLFLGALGLCLVATGVPDHVQYYLFARREKTTREGRA